MERIEVIKWCLNKKKFLLVVGTAFMPIMHENPRRTMTNKRRRDFANAIL